MADTAKLDALWTRMGNTGDRPAGWYGEGGSAENPNYGGGMSGGSSRNYPIPDIKLEDLGSSLSLAKELNATEDTAFSNYLKAAQSQESPLTIYDTLAQRAGIPQLRTTASNIQTQIYDLEDALGKVKNQVASDTQNSLVTQSQRERLGTERRTPLLEQYNPLVTALGRIQGSISDATSDIGTRTGLAMQGQQMQLEPYKMQINMLADRSARIMSGFTADREMSYQIYMDKIQAGQRLSELEWQEAAELAREQRQYQNDMNKLITQYELENQYGNYNQLADLGGRDMLVNTRTGETVRDYGSSRVGSTARSLLDYIPKGQSEWEVE